MKQEVIMFDILKKYKNIENDENIDLQKQIQWISIFSVSNDYTGASVGISQENKWIIKKDNKVYNIIHNNSYMPGLFLLEHDMSHIYKLISKIELETGTKLNFPFEAITKEGMKSDSDYWIDYAFKWYEKLPADNKKTFFEDFKRMEKLKKCHQKIKQKASREVKRISNNYYSD